MKKKVFISACLFFILLHVKGNSFNSKVVSDKIKTCQKRAVRLNHTVRNEYLKDVYLKMYYKLRREIDIANFITSMNEEKDTIFIMEVHNYDSFCLSMTIWNKWKSVSFRKDNRDDSNKVNFEKMLLKEEANSACSDYKKKLITGWDIDELQRESTKYQTLPSPPIYVTRIIRLKNKLRVDCISFDFFFDANNEL